MAEDYRKRSFTKPRCVACGVELTPKRADYDTPKRRFYCTDCVPIRDMKENWKPLGGGTVSRVFIVKDVKRQDDDNA